jgi:hypothetical protein
LFYISSALMTMARLALRIVPLLLDDYRFRTDKSGTQFWSGTVNYCIVPGCTTATVITGQAQAPGVCPEPSRGA